MWSFFSPHIFLLLLLTIQTASAAIPCNDTATCTRLVRAGSVCLETADDEQGGVCSNPFVAGCLQNYLGANKFPHKRVCGSHDPPGDYQNCDPPILDYQELRLLYQDWDGPLLSSWVMQIFLSEVVRVPVSLEPGSDEIVANFYDQYNIFQYAAASYDWDALKKAREIKDCRELVQEPGNYQSCAHVVPEVWNGQRSAYLQAAEEGLIEPAESTGGVGKYSWYIPRFVANADPTLLSYFGLRGDANRKKLAETFLRPTSWHEYCTLVSPTSCTYTDQNTTSMTNDTGTRIALRPPQTEEEGTQYFVEGEYWGYFRKTKENDCDANPKCTGHICNVQCHWSTFLVPQAYHNDVPVVSNGPSKRGGYPFARMQEIWHAANYSKSPVLFYWYTPDPVIQSFLGTDSEVQQVLLPPPTQECVENRVATESRCSDSVAETLGQAEGACDAEAHSTQKLIVANLLEESVSSKSIEEKNPGYEAIKSFRISDLQMAEIFDYWYKKEVDKWGYDPREAVCHWVADNLQDLQRYVPPTFPREIIQVEYDDALHLVAMAMGIICCILTVVTAVAVYKCRKKAVMKYAQVEFVLLILSGLFLVSLGATLGAATPTTGTCVANSWFVLLGYTLELVPLIVKVAAISTLVAASKKMKRIKLKRQDLFRTVFLIVLLVVISLICQTVIDPPMRQKELTLADSKTENGWHVLEVSYYCGSNADIWVIIRVVWQVLLLILAVVLAVQTRHITSEFNESRSLGIMVYSHSVFVVMRVIILALEGTIRYSRLQGFQSLTYSADTFATLLIYFLPMFRQIFVKEEEPFGRRAASFPAVSAALKKNTERESRWSVNVRAVAVLVPSQRNPHTVAMDTKADDGEAQSETQDQKLEQGFEEVSENPRNQLNRLPLDLAWSSAGEESDDDDVGERGTSEFAIHPAHHSIRDLETFCFDEK